MKFKIYLINIISSFLILIFSTLIGFLIPYLIITSYGTFEFSILETLKRFYSLVSLVEFGLGSSAIILIHKNYNQLEEIKSIIASYFKINFKNAILFLIIVILSSFFFAIFLNNSVSINFELLFLAFFFGLNSLFDFYFITPFKVLLSAIEKYYLFNIVFLIYQIFSLLSYLMIIYLSLPLYLIYITLLILALIKFLFFRLKFSNYININRNLKVVSFDRRTRIGGIFFQISNQILLVSPFIFLSFSSLSKANIVYTQMLIITSLISLLSVFTTGISSILGNIFFNSKQKFLLYYEKFFYFFNSISIILFTTSIFMGNSFLSLYSQNFNNGVNYSDSPLFISLNIYGFIIGLNISLNSLTSATANFKNTILINIFSILLSLIFGILIIFFGHDFFVYFLFFYTFSHVFLYFYKLKVYINLNYFMKFIFAASLLFSISILGNFLINLNIRNFYEWFSYSVIIFVFVTILTLLFYKIFLPSFWISYKKIFIDFFFKSKKKIKT